MHSVNAEERRGVVTRKGQREGGSMGGRGRAGGDVCPNVVFFPEIAITQMRCWLEHRCV